MRFLILAAGLAVIATGAFAKKVDWPQPGLDAAHTGFNKNETKISAGNVRRLKQKWEVSIPNGIQSAPIELNGIAYVQSTSDGTVYAVNANNGAIVWSYTAGTPAGLQGVTAGGKLVYAPCNVDANGHSGICALDAATGALVWNFAITSVNGQVPTSSYANNIPVVDHGKVFFAYFYGGFDSPVSGNNVYALNAATGAQIWAIAESTGDKSGGLPLAVADRSVFYQTGGSDTYICAADEATGAAGPCSASLGTGTAALSITNGRVLSQNDDGNGNTLFTAFDANSLSLAWQKSVSGTTSTYSLYPPASANGLAFFYAGQNGFGSLYALSIATGAQQWAYSCNGSSACLDSGVSVANGLLFASCDRESPQKGDQCVFDATSGALLRLYGSLDGSSGSEATPLVANGAQIAVCDANSGSLCKFVP